MHPPPPPPPVGIPPRPAPPIAFTPVQIGALLVAVALVAVLATAGTGLGLLYYASHRTTLAAPANSGPAYSAPSYNAPAQGAPGGSNPLRDPAQEQRVQQRCAEEWRAYQKAYTDYQVAQARGQSGGLAPRTPLC